MNPTLKSRRLKSRAEGQEIEDWIFSISFLYRFAVLVGSYAYSPFFSLRGLLICRIFTQWIGTIWKFETSQLLHQYADHIRLIHYRFSSKFVPVDMTAPHRSTSSHHPMDRQRQTEHTTQQMDGADRAHRAERQSSFQIVFPTWLFQRVLWVKVVTKHHCFGAVDRITWWKNCLEAVSKKPTKNL